MGNPETQATLVTQEYKQTNEKTKQKTIKKKPRKLKR
jgi:hypothetical protein